MTAPNPPTTVEPVSEPGWWEETPAQAAAADRRYWDDYYNRDEE